MSRVYPASRYGPGGWQTDSILRPPAAIARRMYIAEAALASMKAPEPWQANGPGTKKRCSVGDTLMRSSSFDQKAHLPFSPPLGLPYDDIIADALAIAAAFGDYSQTFRQLLASSLGPIITGGRALSPAESFLSLIFDTPQRSLDAYDVRLRHYLPTLRYPWLLAVNRTAFLSTTIPVPIQPDPLCLPTHNNKRRVDFLRVRLPWRGPCPRNMLERRAKAWITTRTTGMFSPLHDSACLILIAFKRLLPPKMPTASISFLVKIMVRVKSCRASRESLLSRCHIPSTANGIV
ncbi:hypothetical protein JVT61DRAFT_12249 [Boletus reticuloceps]|uniref:Uncharacterized protein n=1 Tax=Boletus reticuloceps TaxID=495285 RepID=A0A8I3A395_9AGAM|nr:hypothetical protein JVT61DRAFT_12249 [Boletus reticuloceps]